MIRHIKWVALAFGFGILSIPAISFADSSLSLINIQKGIESGSSTSTNITNPNSSAKGQYQMENGALQDIGWRNSDGTWKSNPYGITSDSQYLSNQQAQEASALSYDQVLWGQLQSNGATSQVGNVVNGVQMNEAAMLECAYQLGAGGCNTYLKSGGQSISTDNPHFVNDLAKASQVADVSSITGAPTSAATLTTASTEGGQLSGGTSAATYCSQQVASLLAANGRQSIDAKTAIAMNGQTGYTLMNGSGVLEAAGASSSGSSSSASPFDVGGGSGGSFMQMSCIDRLMNGGLNVVFNPPSLNDLLGVLEQAVCQKTNALFQQMMQPIDSTLGEVTSQAAGGGFFPGLSLTSLGGSLNMNAGQQQGSSLTVGGVGSVGTNASASSVLTGDTSWYARSTPPNSTTLAFEGLFGTNKSTTSKTTGN